MRNTHTPLYKIAKYDLGDVVKDGDETGVIVGIHGSYSSRSWTGGYRDIPPTNKPQVTYSVKFSDGEEGDFSKNDLELVEKGTEIRALIDSGASSSDVQAALDAHVAGKLGLTPAVASEAVEAAPVAVEAAPVVAPVVVAKPKVKSKIRVAASMDELDEMKEPFYGIPVDGGYMVVYGGDDLIGTVRRLKTFLA